MKTILSVVKTYANTPQQANNLSYWLLKKYYGLNKDGFWKIGIKVPKEKQPGKSLLNDLCTIEATYAHLFFANRNRSSRESVKVVNA
jgi:hypothetical protein